MILIMTLLLSIKYHTMTPFMKKISILKPPMTLLVPLMTKSLPIMILTSTIVILQMIAMSTMKMLIFADLLELGMLQLI